MNKKKIILEIMWQSTIGWNKCIGLLTKGPTVCIPSQLQRGGLNSAMGK